MGVLADAARNVILRVVMQVVLQNSIMAKGTVMIVRVLVFVNASMFASS